MAEPLPGPEWGADFFGSLNELPAEPVAGMGGVLDAMRTLPAYRDARLWVLHNLRIEKGSAVLEAGCGNGASLTEVLAIVGSTGRVLGIDPTNAFIEEARARARSVRRQRGV